MTEPATSLVETAREMRALFERDKFERLSLICGCDTICPECQAGAARAELGIKIADAIETAPAGFANWAKVILREAFP